MILGYLRLFGVGFFIFKKGTDAVMETRVALIGIILSKPEAVEQVNALLHQYRDHIMGRMGLPYREKDISIISVVVDAPADVISAISGKLGMLDGVSSKAIYSKT